MANLTFIVDLPILHGDFPVRKLLVYQRVPSTVENLDRWAVREVRSFSSRVPPSIQNEVSQSIRICRKGERGKGIQIHHFFC